MKKIIDVNGQPVAFAASAATPRLYRLYCCRDIFDDFQRVAAALADDMEGGKPLTPELLDTFEEIAFVMAHEAEPTRTPDTAEAWLEGLTALPIRVIFPHLELLWLDNLTQTVKPAKK